MISQKTIHQMTKTSNKEVTKTLVESNNGDVKADDKKVEEKVETKSTDTNSTDTPTDNKSDENKQPLALDKKGSKVHFVPIKEPFL